VVLDVPFDAGFIETQRAFLPDAVVEGFAYVTHLGDPLFFLGTDSAPTADAAKETACGCAGWFTEPVALACLAHVFEAEGALERLEGFAAQHRPAFYGLAPNEGRITLGTPR
jgi:dihydroorotase